MLYQDAYLTTLDAVKQHLDLTGTDAGDDRVVENLIASASDMITQMCQRVFIPHRDTRQYDARGEHLQNNDFSNQILRLDADLLSVDTLTNGDSTTVASGQYALRGRGYPKWAIELLPSAGIYWTYSTDWQNAISIVGIWGYHEDYDHAWVNTLDTIQDVSGINATVQAITCADADGKDGRYRNRFAVGQQLKIESEYLKVVAVNTTSNVLTVLRGVNGTTAATHAKDTAIYSYAPMRNIEMAAIALTAWLYRNAPTAGDAMQILRDGTKVIPGDMPRFIRDALQAYANVRV